MLLQSNSTQLPLACPFTSPVQHPWRLPCICWGAVVLVLRVGRADQDCSCTGHPLAQQVALSWLQQHGSWRIPSPRCCFTIPDVEADLPSPHRALKPKLKLTQNKLCAELEEVSRGWTSLSGKCMQNTRAEPSLARTGRTQRRVQEGGPDIYSQKCRQLQIQGK